MAEYLAEKSAALKAVLTVAQWAEK
jgi:hypothetical protein